VPDPDTREEEGPSYAELQAALEDVEARRAEHLLAVRRREVVEADRLKGGFTERGHGVRDLLLAAPVRQAATLAARHGGLEPGIVAAELTKIIRTALFAISKGPQPPGEG